MGREGEIMRIEWEGRGQPDSDPRSVTEALVESCVVSDAVVVGPDGAVRYDGVSTARWELSLVLEDGTWLVSRSDSFDGVEGVASCAEA
jgi:hypothetical protein